MAYHWLRSACRQDVYVDYLNGRIGREGLYAEVPRNVLRAVINEEIRPDTMESIYREIDSLLRNRTLDLLIGGPPCQAYSIVGRSRDPKRMVEDERNYLYRCYASFLQKYRPKRFVFENVSGLLSARDGKGQSYLDAIRRLFGGLDYDTQFSTLCAKDYGVLQNRKRVVLIGDQRGNRGRYPEPEQWAPGVTVSDVFADLPAVGAWDASGWPRRPSGPTRGASSPSSSATGSGCWNHEPWESDPGGPGALRAPDSPASAALRPANPAPAKHRKGTLRAIPEFRSQMPETAILHPVGDDGPFQQPRPHTRNF